MGETNLTQLRYDADKKSAVVAYLLWVFLGSFGAHRIYLSRWVSGLAMLALSVAGWVLTLVFVGFAVLIAVLIWWFVDLFLVGGWVREHNNRVIDALTWRETTRLPPASPS